MNELRIMDGELVFATEKFELARNGPEVWYHPKQYKLYEVGCAPYVVVAAPGPEPGIAPNLHLLPGPYRFWVDVESNLVVGVAAPAAAIAAREHERRLHELLAATQQLDAQTMEENRSLRMTDRQRKKLGRARGSAIGWMVVGILAFLAYMLCRDVMARNIGPFTIVEAIVFLVFLLIVPSSVRDQRRANGGTKKDVREGRLDAVEGVLEKRSRMSSNGFWNSTARFSLEMNGETFDVSEDPRLYAVLVQGCRYRAYVARHSRRLVTIELLEGPVLEST